ncbi:hypothetical protein F5Y03DRAFT_290413 [Xylaria venustula]|nr:hypothetical protein F5Y03DRAFT_290413 [Xylaria venustula]
MSPRVSQRRSIVLFSFPLVSCFVLQHGCYIHTFRLLEPLTDDVLNLYTPRASTVSEVTRRARPVLTRQCDQAMFAVHRRHKCGFAMLHIPIGLSGWAGAASATYIQYIPLQRSIIRHRSLFSTPVFRT